MKAKATDLNQQITILLSRGMIINDYASAKDCLSRKNYYNLINGTKDFILDKNNTKHECYKSGINFDEVFSIYDFGEKLRSIFLKFILIAENELRTHIAYEFSQKFSSQGRDNIKFFKSNCNKVAFQDLQDTISESIKVNKIVDSKTNLLNSAQASHKKIPLWILVNYISFGTLKRFYLFLDTNLANYISNQYYGINKSYLVSFLETLNMFRNVFAHDFRIFFYKIYDINKKIKDTSIHLQLNISKSNKGNYKKGKDDLFAVVIILKYLLTEKDFASFVKKLKVSFYTLKSKLKVVTLDEIYDSLGFPHNSNGEKNRKHILKMYK